MKHLSSSNKIYISESKTDNHGVGRGVFAKEKIIKGEVIELCPLIEIPEYEFENLGSSILLEYIFFFGKEKEKACLALGFGSLYNHSSTPNAEYKIKEKEKLLEIQATKDIEANEEITFNYKGNSKLPLWFEV